VATSIVIMMGRSRSTAPSTAALQSSARDAHLVDVLQHDDAGLHRDAEQREEADAGRDAESCMRKESEQAADGAMMTFARISMAHLNEPNMP
jgi:hypothetical protein